MIPSRSTAAFEALYRTEYARVLRFFRKRVGGEDAPDLAQEVFIKLFAAGVAEHIENPQAYLVRCARNLLIDRARRKTSAHIVTCPIDEGWMRQSLPNRRGELRSAMSGGSIDGHFWRCREKPAASS